MSQTAPLIKYLKQLEREGVRHIRLDESAKEVLRKRLRKRTVPAPTSPPPTYHKTVPLHSAPPASIPSLKAQGSTPEEKIASLKAQAEDWEPARSLGSLRETMVFATGNPAADIMLVGEAPGYEEERRQEPFVGRAGQKLDQILSAMGLARGEVYISTICN